MTPEAGLMESVAVSLRARSDSIDRCRFGHRAGGFGVGAEAVDDLAVGG